MRRITKKVLLPILCVVALCVSAFGMLGITGSANSTTTVKSVYDDDGDGVVTAWDIIERDGYIEGCWYPWFTHSWLGSSLCESSEMEAIDSWFDADKYLSNGTTTATKDYWQNMNECGFDQLGAEQIKMEIFNLKALGFNMMAYMGSPWGEGVKFETGTWKPIGVKDEYLKNMRNLLNICREVGMPVLWYVHCHSSAVPAYASLDMWYRITQSYSYPEEYAENFVEPVAKVLAEYRDVVVMVGLTDELENEMNDSNYVADPKFDEGDRHEYGVTQELALKFQGAIGQKIKEIMPDMPTTFASNKEDFAMNGESMIDFVGRNQYTSSSSGKDLSTAWPIGPMLATEYGTGDGTYGGTEDEWANVLIEKRNNFLNLGYTGFFHWAYQPTLSTGNAGGNQYLKKGATMVHHFRKGMLQVHDYAEKKMNELKPANHPTTGAPSAMYYHGGTIQHSISNGSTSTKQNITYKGKVFWIQPKGVTTYKVERSTNGGQSWTQISGQVSIDADTGSYLYCMTDPSPVSSGSVQYRITVNNKTSYTNVWTY